MDQEDIAKYLALMSGEVGCTETKVGEKKVRAEKELKDIDEHLPATTSFFLSSRTIHQGKVEDPEVVSLPDKDSVSLTDSESSSSLWAVTPMSCSTLSVSSEWESTDSVERATSKRSKELKTDCYQ